MNLGLRAAARALGVSHTRLLALWKEDRIPRNKDGTFDLDACREAFAFSTDPSQRSKIAKEAPTPKAEPARPAPAAARPRSESEIGLPSPDAGFTRLRSAHLALKIKREDFRIKKDEAKFVPTEDVRRVWSAAIVTLKSRLLLIPAKVAPRIVGCTEPLECEVVIESEIRAALEELARYRPNAAA